MQYVAGRATGGAIFEAASGALVRWSPVLVGLGVFAFSTAGLDLGPIPADAKHGWLLAGCAMCGAVAGLARWWLWPLFVLAPIALVGVLLWPPVVVAAFYAGYRLRGRRLVAFGAAAVAVEAASALVNQLIGGYRAVWGSVSNTLLEVIVFVALPMVLGLWLVARRGLLDELRDRADRAEREQAARAEAARSTERARIAREMHDVVAHRVSLMVLHAGAIEVTATDGEVTAEAALIRTTGRAALTDLRAVLGVLRTRTGESGTSPQPGLAELPALVDQSRSAGVPVTLHVEAASAGAPGTVQRTAYRVVQEALTNVHKHAGRVPTAVRVAVAAGALTVEVRNEPPGEPVEPAVSGRLGLAGLRERVALLGGECRAGADPDGGFTVSAVLPVPAGTAAA
ncbi:histidine kinase [Actinocatenispora sera]|uniref:sensor histidine kinase n=1 Tax=Actinocatenispora sera TaxID=390989 RepID=UPI0033C44A54